MPRETTGAKCKCHSASNLYVALDSELYPHHMKFIVVKGGSILRTDCLWEATVWPGKRECQGQLKLLQIEALPHRVAMVLEGA